MTQRKHKTDEDFRRNEESLSKKTNISKPFRGYSLSELEFRKEVNNVKQIMVTENLKATFAAFKQNNETGIVNKFNSIMAWADYGIIGWKIFTRLRGIFGSKQK